MKKFSLLIAVLFLITSCGNKATDNAESAYIPKNVVGLAYINIKSLSEKSGDLDFKELKINQIIEENAPSDVRMLFNDLMTTENINKTFRKEFVFGFGTVKRMSGFGGLVLPIKDGASFENFINPLIEELPSLEKEEKAGKDEAFTIYFTDEIAIGWNEKTALIIGADKNAAAELKDLTSLEKDKSIASTDYFGDFFNTKKDMGLHLTTDSLGAAFNGLLSMTTGMNLDIENNSFTYYGNFEDDHIHTIANLKLNNDVKSLLGYENWMTESFENNLLDVMPKDIMLLAKLSVDPTEINNHIKGLKDNKVLAAGMREEFGNEYEEANEGIQKEIGMDLKELANTFNGSLLFGISEGITVKDTIYEYDYYNYRENKEKYEVVDKKIPYMYGVIGIENKDSFDKLFNKMLEENSKAIKVSDKLYQLDKDTQVAINDDFILITNDNKSALQVSKNGEIENNLSGFEHKSKLSNTLYMYTKGNISGLSNTIESVVNPYGGYYGSSNNDDMYEKSDAIYKKYFGESHYYTNTDVSESHTYTKGDKNSLVQSILYVDEFAQLFADEEKKAEEEVETMVEDAVDAAEAAVEEAVLVEELDEAIEDVEETIIESTEAN